MDNHLLCSPQGTTKEKKVSFQVKEPHARLRVGVEDSFVIARFVASYSTVKNKAVVHII